MFSSKLTSVIVMTGQVRSICSASTVYQKKYSAPKKIVLPFKEQKVSIDTCGELYETWRKENTFRIVPKGNLKFDVKYIDTALDSKNHADSPTVLMLHGSPGKYNDLGDQINFLHSHGARIIAPNFSEFSDHPPCQYKHSGIEKYHFVKDFLNAINVHRLDMVVAHSSATYPLLHLYLKNDNKYDIGALAFLNPGGHKRISNLYPVLGYNIVFKSLANYKYGYPAAKALFKLIMAILRPPLRPESFDKTGLAGMTQFYSGYETAEKLFIELAKNQPPTLVMFSDNDVLMNKEITYEVVYQLLGAHPNDLWAHDDKGKLIQTGNDMSWLKVLSFAKGSHYCFWKYSDIVNQSLIDLLTRSARQSLVAKQRI